jgi:hypothetical protein
VQDAFADGQISYADLDARLHSVLTARSHDELVAAHDSLPARDEGRVVTIVAKSGRIRRRGAWRVPRVLHIESEFGPVELDLSSASIETPQVDLELRLRFGRAKITLPADAVVDLDELQAVWKQPRYEPPQFAPSPGGTLVRISGTMEFGRLKIRHQRPRRATR